jgi:hypothetical protein
MAQLYRSQKGAEMPTNRKKKKKILLCRQYFDTREANNAAYLQEGC